MKRRSGSRWGALAALGLVLTLLVGIPTATAVHDDGLFQLDYVTAPTPQGAANVSSTNITPNGNVGDDWDEVYGGTSGAFATSFIADPTGDAETSFFTGGGSKDERDISGAGQHWEWDNANDVIPNKDDISNAFAAAYSPTSGPDAGHTIFYFGADRFATNGDAEIGFWFFKQPVTLGTEPNFNGAHTVGDILVLANWGGSNKVGDIAVYKWIGGNNPLQLVKDTTQADCSVAPSNDPVCGVTSNVGGETPPWSYTNTDGAHSYQAQALFEGGIDLSDPDLGLVQPGGDIGCFSSFLAETRSSHSTTAQLKDFALGAFPVCGVKVTKTGDTLSKIGDAVEYTIKVQNTGRATLYKRNISDSLLGAITTNGVDQANSYVVSNTCDVSLAKNDNAAGGADECTITLKRTVQAGDPDPLPNTVSILYTEKADFTGLAFNSSDDHEVNLFQPAVLIDKKGDGLSKIGDPVTYTFTITNKSSEDSPNLNLASISDNVIGDLSAAATAAGCDVLSFEEQCSFQVTRTVLAADGDPLDNKVDVVYNPAGFPNKITASDGHSVNLFQPEVKITKDGNGLSKIGDDVTYKFKITNSGSGDSPNLILDSIKDDVLGDLSDEAPASCDSIAAGESCEFEVPWTVAAVDVNPADGNTDDPVINTVSIHFHPDAFPNDITATASHKLNLFQPKIAFEKTADTKLSKATDDVNYALTLNNISSADSPAMNCAITDAKLGVDKQVTLKPGEGDVINLAYTVQADDPDPLVNEASVKCTFDDFPNVLEASDSWSVNLFQPSVMIEKTGDELSKVGDEVKYHFTITNTSSADSPNLMLVSIGDTVLGPLTAPAACDNLTPGAFCDFSVPWKVVDGLGDPVVNTVEVHYHPVDFPNDITDKDDHSLNLFQPAIAAKKTGDTLSKVGDDVNYTFTLSNNSSADTPAMNCVAKDSLVGDIFDGVLPLGDKVINKTRTVQKGDPDPLPNTLTLTCSPEDFPNVLEASAKHEVNLFQPGVTVDKTGDTLSKVGDDVNYKIVVTNTGSSDSPELVNGTIIDTLLGNLLDPANPYVTSNNCSATLATGADCTITATRTVLAGDADPLPNTVTAHYKPKGFPNDITASDDHSVELFQPTIKFAKGGDTRSKIGDEVTYTFDLENTSSADSPSLDCVISDEKIKYELKVTLKPGEISSTKQLFTIPDTADDPFINKAEVSCKVQGFTNVLTASDDHSVNLFQPSITFDKTGDELSKVGDDVAYKLTLKNTSSADTPDLVCTVTDALIGVNEKVTKASGEEAVINAVYTVKAGDKDPLVNEASVSCSPTGFPNVLKASDTHSVNLFQPSVDLEKTGPAFSKAGDTAEYKVTIKNTSSADSPDLVLDVDGFIDSLVPGATLPASCSPLAPGASCSVEYTYDVQAGDPDPLKNTATVHYNPKGFPNDITDSSTATVDLVHPSFTVTKVCKAEPINQEGPAVFTITFKNTGDADLHVVPSEGAPFDVLAGQPHSYDHSIAGPFTATVDNTVTGTVTLASKYGLTNSYEFSAKDSCDVKGKVKVVKTVSGQPPAAGQTFTFQLRQDASINSDGTVLETKATDASGKISFETQLAPGKTYQICEWVFPGWNTNLAGDGPLFVPNSLIPPALPNPNVNNLTVCTDFTVESGNTRTFTVDNTPPPGGRALTIGFWKNWASCANSNGKGQKPMLDLALGIATKTTTNPPGGLVVSAEKPGALWPNYEAAYYLVLNGDPASTEKDIKPAPSCAQAVNLLSKTTIDGKTKKSSDPLFNMTAQLVAAQLNRFMGAGINGTTITQINQAVLLNGKYKFSGLTYSPKLSTADANLANCLGTQLDNYNNNRPVSAC
jgi:hypothetical protein